MRVPAIEASKLSLTFATRSSPRAGCPKSRTHDHTPGSAPVARVAWAAVFAGPGDVAMTRPFRTWSPAGHTGAVATTLIATAIAATQDEGRPPLGASALIRSRPDRRRPH